MQNTSATAAALPLPDAEIARRVAAGDHAAFAQLMRRHNRLLYRTARAILKDDAEAEDALQDAYLLAFRAIANFRGEARLSTWLVRIVANEALGRLRKRARVAEVTYLDESARDEPERAALRTEVLRLIESKVDHLPDAFRTVFVLRALEEMSVEETAAALDIPEATVRSHGGRGHGEARSPLVEFQLRVGRDLAQRLGLRPDLARQDLGRRRRRARRPFQPVFFEPLHRRAPHSARRSASAWISAGSPAGPNIASQYVRS